MTSSFLSFFLFLFLFLFDFSQQARLSGSDIIVTLYFPETESKVPEGQAKQKAEKQPRREGQESDDEEDVFEDAQETIEPVRQEDKVLPLSTRKRKMENDGK